MVFAKSKGNNRVIQITSNFNNTFSAKMILSHVFIFRGDCAVAARIWSFVHPKMGPANFMNNDTEF